MVGIRMTTMAGSLLAPSDGDLIMLVSTDRKPYIFRLSQGEELQTNRGVLKHDAMINQPWGSIIASHLGKRFYLLQPTLRDLLLFLPRRSQIIFPKDLGYILLRLSIGQGGRVAEAGCGSGALTMGLAWAVGPEGRVLSCDRRQDMIDLARGNLERVGLEARVEFLHQDLADGLPGPPVDSLFLDLPKPHEYLPQVERALRGGGVLGAILPTTNQVSDFLRGLRVYAFRLMDVAEISLRFYKVIPDRLRPVDRMVAHTGYLVFARRVTPGDDNAEGEEQAGFAES
jgi:tRNA (adenine57-N1/adenine58-N1)-methyltransferase